MEFQVMIKWSDADTAEAARSNLRLAQCSVFSLMIAAVWVRLVN